jgi:hypothetical protein
MLSGIDAPSGFRETIVAIMRNATRSGRVNALVKFTRQSIIYRRKAAELAMLAESEPDETKMLPLIHQAMVWIQMVENEEFLVLIPENLH